VIVVQLLASFLILSLGPAVLWWRRDNVLAYQSAGFFVSAYVLPLFPILTSYRLDHGTVRLYADILSVGAVAFAAGLFLGGRVEANTRPRLPLTFARPMSPAVVDRVTRWARRIGVAGLLALGLAFVLMGYVPLFAADRVSAKYGVGPYRPSFARAALIYRFGLAASAAILPVLLASFWRRRRLIDLFLCLGLVGALVVSLNRGAAFLGPLVFVTAVLIERRIRPAIILLLVVVTFSVGALMSILLLDQSDALRTDVAERVAASTPDVRDHLLFLRSYEIRREPTYGRTLLAGLAFRKTAWDPSTYALSTLTGLKDPSEFASGGLRLPAPLWGYVSFGWAGVAMFSAVSGLFSGWGYARLKRVLTPVLDSPGVVLNLTVATLFYEATYGVLAEFYFLTSSVVVLLAMAAAVAVAVRVVVVRGARRRPAAPKPLRTVPSPTRGTP
jgi:hypothetical protein